jgi:hypothetical protein
VSPDARIPTPDDTAVATLATVKPKPAGKPKPAAKPRTRKKPPAAS